MYGVKYEGKLKSKKSSEIMSSRLGIGLEKLDRNLYDPNSCYDPIADIGVKWVRIQSGWCRTEKEKGVYDFSWLDEIVDNLLERNLIPWICLCYGNELYTKDANNAYGAVGRPPIFTQEERSAWYRYVAACVKHFKGRVEYYEIWNEPDGHWCWRHGVNANEYGIFAIDTAKAVRESDPNAKVIAGSFSVDISFLYGMLTTGLSQYIDYVTYHRYRHDVDNSVGKYTKCIRGILNQFNDKIGIIQGETGAPSAYSTQGAMNRGCWTPVKQTKFLLRKMMIDLSTEAVFTSYFTTVDCFENIANDSGIVTKDYFGFFGVLGAEFDEQGIPTGKYYKKDSYTAFQALCSLMHGNIKKEALPVCFTLNKSWLIGGMDENAESDKNNVYSFGFSLDSGMKAFIYWKSTDIMTTDFEATVSLKIFGLSEKIKLVDLYDGSVYSILPENTEAENGVITLKNIPIKDYPLALCFEDDDKCLDLVNSAIK